MDNLGYLFAVFSIVWLVVFAYILSLIRKLEGLRREIDSLKKMLEESRSV